MGISCSFPRTVADFFTRGYNAARRYLTALSVITALKCGLCTAWPSIQLQVQWKKQASLLKLEGKLTALELLRDSLWASNLGAYLGNFQE